MEILEDKIKRGNIIMSEMEDGKVEVMGINVDIHKILGEKIVDQYIAQLSEEDVNKILSYIDKDLWDKNYKDEKVVKESPRDRWGEAKQVSIGDKIRKQFAERVNEEVAKKCEEIVASQDFKDKVEEIAQEVVDYATEGYKKDLKERVRQRLVGNVFESMPMYDGADLISIIQSVVSTTIGTTSY